MKLNKKIKAVFFDFDGVLIDSKSVMEISWSLIQKKYSISIDFDIYSKFIGIPFSDILKSLHIELSLHERIKADYFESTSNNKLHIKLNKYSHSLLLWLRKNSIATGLVTSKDKIRTNELIEYFKLKFDTIVTPENTEKGKPYPEPIYLASNRLNLQVSNVLYVGDMRTDLLSAQSAKCRYLHFQKGYQRIINLEYGGEIYSLLDIKDFLYYL